jgi:hypothetical protein
MCLSCLKNQLASFDDYDKCITEDLAKLTCECCRSYPSFLKRINQDLKVICLTKIKIHEQVCPKSIQRLVYLEMSVKQRVKESLQNTMEQLDEAKDDISEGKYLDKANQLKSLNDVIELMEEADHR